MYNVNKIAMNVLINLFLSSMLCLGLASGLTGCKDPAEGSQQVNAPEKTKKQRFEEARAFNRKTIADQAALHPEDIAQVTLSLFTYFPISYLEEFSKTYPNLKITGTEVMVRDGSGWEEINPQKPLTEELKRVKEVNKEFYLRRFEATKEMNPREFSEKQIKDTIANDQKYVDAANADRYKTYAFTVLGKLKDIEAMAKKEYNGKYLRVIKKNTLLEGVYFFMVTDPIEQADDKEAVNKDRVK